MKKTTPTLSAKFGVVMQDFIGSDNGDFEIGTPNDDTFDLLGGSDIVLADFGNDTIQGGDGDDFLYGQGDNDILIGQAGNDELNGGDGNDRLNGGAGADSLYGGSGNDIYNFVDADDIIVEDASIGIDTVRTLMASYTLGANVENLTLLGGLSQTGTGNEANNVIISFGGNDTLYGLGGNDSLDGGAGQDTLFGGDGDDALFGQGGNDSLNGDDGNDSLFGGAGRDTLKGGLGEDALNGDYGNDILIGGDGIDRLLGGNGNDTLDGGADSDLLYGEAGTDIINGGDGDDLITGGAGRDILTGGAGADSFSYISMDDFGGLTPATMERITDFSIAEGDTIDLRGLERSLISLETITHFSIIGHDAFSQTAGELRYEVVGGNTYLYGDTNGDGAADFALRLTGVVDFDAGGIRTLGL